MSDFFETSYGDKITLMPGVERVMYPDSGSEEHFKDVLENSFVSERFLDKQVYNKIKIKEITSDLNTFTLVIDYLEELRLLSREYETALDIAGCEGIHASLLRGHYAKQVDVADVQDGTDPELTKRLKRALWKFRFQKVEDRLFKGGAFNHRVKRVKNKKHVNIPTFKNFYNFDFKRKPMVDNFIVGDWRKTVTKQYDLIMNYMSFWIWDHKTSIQKISASLNPGGIFVVLAPYCWAGRGIGDGGALLGGEFPFFEQRLTLEDTKRYYQQFKPNLARYVEDAYNCFDPHRPTVNDYVDCATRNNLVVRGTKRLYNDAPNLGITYKEFFGDKIVVNPEVKSGVIADAGEVLQNIHRFRTDVTFEDLLTRGVIMVFQKPH